MKTLLGGSGRIKTRECWVCHGVRVFQVLVKEGKEEGEKLPGFEVELQFSTVKRFKSRHSYSFCL